MNDTMQHIKHIELYTKRLIQANLFGHSRSHVKGSGLEFDQLRDYQIGDDVRVVDWNSSARNNKLLVKQFYEEKYRTVIIAIDISASVFYGSEQLKFKFIADIGTILAYAAYLNKDEISLILFSDDVEFYISPRKGKNQVHAIIEKIFSVTKKNTQTNIKRLLEYIARLRKKNSMVFVISDFVDEKISNQISFINQWCDVIAVRITDGFESKLPSYGFVTVQDVETKEQVVIDTRSTSNVSFFLHDRLKEQKKLFAACRIDLLDICIQNPIIEQLITFFRIRKR